MGPAGRQSEPMALVSLILGIVSLPGHFCCYLGWPLGIAAIVLGIVSLTKIKKEPQRYSGAGMAWGGIASAAVGFLLILLMLVIYGAAVIATSV
jgi:hypothetical protein